VDAEVSRAYSVDARGDDTTGSPAAGGPDDEDALSITGDVVVRPGSNYTLPPITCNAAARGSRVAGWIGWNANGTFDANERSNVATCAPGAGTVSLTFAVTTSGTQASATTGTQWVQPGQAYTLTDRMAPGARTRCRTTGPRSSAATPPTTTPLSR